jgi:hypothetical protein
MRRRGSPGRPSCQNFLHCRHPCCGYGGGMRDTPRARIAWAGHAVRAAALTPPNTSADATGYSRKYRTTTRGAGKPERSARPDRKAPRTAHSRGRAHLLRPNPRYALQGFARQGVTLTTSSVRLFCGDFARPTAGAGGADPRWAGPEITRPQRGAARRSNAAPAEQRSLPGRTKRIPSNT